MYLVIQKTVLSMREQGCSQFKTLIPKTTQVQYKLNWL